MTRIVTPEEFARCFRGEVRKFEDQLFEQWGDPKAYTATFCARETGVLSRIASKLRLEYHREAGKVDAIFYESLDGHRGVSVAIEHEHSSPGSSREAWALSVLNVPLKVLITYPYPSDSSEERRLLDSYVAVFRATDMFGDFHNLRKQLVIFGFANDSIGWHYYVYTKKGFVRSEVTR